jgi:glycosyltransferase 2 family protein
VHHGTEVGDLGRAVRAVVWERTAGQVVQVVMAVVVLFVLPSPVRPRMPAAVAVLLGIAVAAGLVARGWSRGGWSRGRSRGGRSRSARAFRTAASDVRAGLLARGTGLRIVLVSAVAVAGHLATFLIAARTAGATAPLTRLVPLTLLALLAMGVPVNIGGFGPREGVAAWAFGAAGLSAGQGVTTAVVYGALVFAASLPGAGVLILRRARFSGATLSGPARVARVARVALVDAKPVRR